MVDGRRVIGNIVKQVMGGSRISGKGVYIIYIKMRGFALLISSHFSLNIP